MFFYIYGDHFQLYETGQLQQMLAGRMPFAAISQGVLLGMAGVMIVPSLMPFLSLVLPVRLNRWLNIIFGGIYSRSAPLGATISYGPSLLPVTRVISSTSSSSWTSG
jgi:hypothetical protein